MVKVCGYNQINFPFPNTKYFTGIQFDKHKLPFPFQLFRYEAVNLWSKLINSFEFIIGTGQPLPLTLETHTIIIRNPLETIKNNQLKPRRKLTGISAGARHIPIKGNWSSGLFHYSSKKKSTKKRASWKMVSQTPPPPIISNDLFFSRVVDINSTSKNVIRKTLQKIIFDSEGPLPLDS